MGSLSPKSWEHVFSTSFAGNCVAYRQLPLGLSVFIFTSCMRAAGAGGHAGGAPSTPEPLGGHCAGE